MMDPLLFEALKSGAKIVHLVTVELPDHVIRWSDGGFVRWQGQTYRARDPRYGVLESIGEITDGVGDDATGHMTAGSWLFIGWQATSDAGGEYPSNPTPPPGWGGSGEQVVIQ